MPEDFFPIQSETMLDIDEFKNISGEFDIFQKNYRVRFNIINHSISDASSFKSDPKSIAEWAMSFAL